MKIKSIKIRGFRGFNIEQELNLDADIVLIYGLNGTGKSSLAEAFEWLFFDDISRRRLSPCPGEYRSGIYLKNFAYNQAHVPFVEAVIQDESGTEFVYRKELLTEKSSRILFNGKEMKGTDSILTGVKRHHTPILAQVEISALVNTEQKDRWEQLSSILGQEELSILRSSIIELRSSKKDAEYKKNEQIFIGVLRDIESSSLPKDFKDAFEHQDYLKLKTIVENNLIDQALELTGSLEEKIKSIIAKVAGTELGKRIAELSPIDNRIVKGLTGNLQLKFESLVILAETASKGQYSSDEAKFLTIGLNIASPPLCPFCGRETLSSQRVESLQEGLAADTDSINSRKKFDETLQELALVFKSLPVDLLTLVPSPRELKTISQKLGEVNLATLSGKVNKYTEDTEEYINNVPKQLKLVFDGLCRTIEDKYFHNGEAEVSAAKSAALKYLEEVFSSIEERNLSWQQLRKEILLQFPSRSSDQSTEEIRKWILIEKALTFLASNPIFLRKYRLIEVVTVSIQQKLKDFEKAELESLLVEHSAEIKNYYARLNPADEISFGQIQVREGEHRQAKLVAYDSKKREINPVTIFSEAHINSLSLSIYFPQRVDRNPIWNTILLDDPVQSMDNNHAHTLIDILRDKSRDKQIIVLTHSKEFSEDMHMTFLYEDLLFYEFYGADENGPKIKLHSGNTSECLNFVETNRNGTSVQREGAANALRKAIESVMGEILMKNGRTISQIRNYTKRGFPQLFDQLERINSIDKGDLGILRGLLNEGHEGSHKWSIRDLSPGGLKRGIDEINRIDMQYLTDHD